MLSKIIEANTTMMAWTSSEVYGSRKSVQHGKGFTDRRLYSRRGNVDASVDDSPDKTGLCAIRSLNAVDVSVVVVLFCMTEPSFSSWEFKSTVSKLVCTSSRLRNDEKCC